VNVTGTLSIVATPIGNLEDMTYRAVRTLQEVDEILCEDTRTSSILLKHYAIQTPTQSFHAHTSPAKKEAIIQKLLRGSNLALISDAGTPGISDPGFVLIEAAIAAGITVVPIPGASAIITALCASGLDTHQFSYLGFAPLKKGRMTLFREIAESPYTSVLYESVHRLEKTLSQLQEAC
jgi:16S rRNA (cytidine1402-2'-O)-methyltransferase